MSPDKNIASHWHSLRFMYHKPSKIGARNELRGGTNGLEKYINFDICQQTCSSQGFERYYNLWKKGNWNQGIGSKYR